MQQEHLGVFSLGKSKPLCRMFFATFFASKASIKYFAAFSTSKFLQENKSWIPYGVEPTIEFAELTQKQLNCPVHAGSYSRDIFNTKFDLVTCNQVLEHTINPMDFLNDIVNDLNHGGYLYIEVPDAIDFEELSPEHDRFLAQHLWYFSRAVLEKMFKAVGFKVIKIESLKTIRGRNNLVSLLLKE